MTDPVPSKDQLAHWREITDGRYETLLASAAREMVDEIVRLREDCRRWENARNVWMAEEKRLKAQVSRLKGYICVTALAGYRCAACAARLTAQPSKPAHEREMPHCSTCSCPPYPAPEPAAEPTPRYQCMVKGCPGNHPSKWGVCDTRPYEAIAVWLDANGSFQWDFETNEDHPIDATIALARRTNWVMTDAGWRLAQPPRDGQ